MIQIRNGIFETNSSSIHAISVYTKPPNEIPKHIHLQLGEYGWECSSYPLPNYIFTACAKLDRLDELEDMLIVLGVSYTMDPSPDVIRREHDENGYLSYKYGGDIDHCYELNDFIDAIMCDEELFKCAMFNPQSQVNTGNDNGGDYPDPIVGDDWYNYEKEN